MLSVLSCPAGVHSFLHPSSPGSIEVYVYVNAHESVYDIYSVSAHISAYKSIYGM